MAMPVPRSRVGSDVFTRARGDCYFCVEPTSSIIHYRCWCTHFTSKGSSVVHTYPEEDLQQKMNCWHTTPHTGWEKRGSGSEAVTNMVIKEIWSGRWGSKSRGRRGKDLICLSSSYLTNSVASNPLYLNKRLQRKRLSELPTGLKVRYGGIQHFLHRKNSRQNILTYLRQLLVIIPT